MSLTKSRFGDYLFGVYPNKLEVKDTDTQKSTSYLDLHLGIDNGGRLKTKLYNKRDDFTFSMVNFPFISSYIPASPAYEFTFHNLYVVFELVPSTMIFWRYLSCSHQSCSNKATLLLC